MKRKRSRFTWLILPIALSSHSEMLTDPTRPFTDRAPEPPVTTATPEKRLFLEFTLVASDRSVAVINGRLVSEGDSVDGARVLMIRKNEVLVIRSGRRMTLHLLPDIVKRKL